MTKFSTDVWVGSAAPSQNIDVIFILCTIFFSVEVLDLRANRQTRNQKGGKSPTMEPDFNDCANHKKSNEVLMLDDVK